ncbi:MAG: VOC family protein [Pseudomonadota bacterium]
MNQFHLSIGANSLEESTQFFQDVLGGRVTVREKDNGANVDVLGSQIFLKNHPGIKPSLPDFHFGFNLGIDDFEKLAQKIMVNHPHVVTMEPKVIDAGTELERKKMYLKSPSGYVIEIKGYK